MRIVIAGAGLAAQRCAETLRANGHDGPITMFGAEPTRRTTARRSPRRCSPGSGRICACGRRTWHADHDVDLRTDTRVTGLDDLAYDRAADRDGREAGDARPPGRDNVHVLRTLDDALASTQALATAGHIAIVGAGLIGQEVASAAVARGIKATLIDAVANPFDALMGPGGGHHLRALHERAGVSQLGRRLIGVRDDGAAARRRHGRRGRPRPGCRRRAAGHGMDAVAGRNSGRRGGPHAHPGRPRRR